MKAKEKAKELFDKHFELFFDIDHGVDVSKDTNRYNGAKLAALLTAEEVQTALTQADVVNEGHWVYWEEIKAEIELL